MTILPIIIAPDSRLKITAEPVSEVDAEICQLMDDMLETMYDAPGIGLAAPQVGQSCRVIVVDVGNDTDDNDERNPVCMANPELTWLSDEEHPHEEGCLSLPDHYADVVRPDGIRVTFLDRDNTTQELETDGLLATCIQHEIDHLDGILFVDHVSTLKRNMILRKLVKAKKQAA